MQFDVRSLGATLRELGEVSGKLAEDFRAASDASDEVFDALRPFTREWSELGNPAALDDLTRDSLATRLDAAIAQFGTIRAGIDDAFGSGTWVSDVMEQNRGFHQEARDALVGRTLGAATPDYAMDLLRQNNFAQSEAMVALRNGDVARIVDDSMFRHFGRADETAFADSAKFAQSWQRP